MKASIYIATTLDGFIAREHGELDWLPGSDGKVEAGFENEDFRYNAFMDSVDVLVMGRSTYNLVLSFGQWPYGHKRVIVLSNSLHKLSANLPSSVELKSCSPNELYVELQESGATHLYIDGGKTIQGFLDSGLINDIILTRVPILIGRGIPLFGNLSEDIKLKHIETQSYKNGFVQSKYEVLN